jgi:hypothetical protein
MKNEFWFHRNSFLCMAERMKKKEKKLRLDCDVICSHKIVQLCLR